jgi:lysophospholipase L1-like esterase
MISEVSMKVLVRGGSIAAGVGVRRGYVDILKDFCTSRGVEVVNCSRPRENSFDGIWTFQKDIEPYTPDILLIHFGVDDAFFPVYRSEFKENLVRMVRSARECFNPIIVMPTSHTLDDPYEMDAVNIYYRTIREVCIDLDCEMVPVHTYWAGYIQDYGLSNTDLVQKDCRLPNERGHEVFAEVIIQRLKRIISEVTALTR